MHGFFWQRFFRHVGIIGGCGVGCGSLVFGGVLLEPEQGLYADPAWTGLGVDWQAGWRRTMRPRSGCSGGRTIRR